MEFIHTGKQINKMGKTLVVIYNHNMPDLTDQLYESLKPHELSLYDTIIIDNGSSQSGKSKYTTYETGENCYFGGALNLAMQLFRENEQYDSLLSLNNDIILHGANFVKELRRVMFTEDYTILSPCVLQPEKNQCHWKCMLNWGSINTRKVPWVDFQSPMIHRRFLEAMPQFPNELMYGWGQDILSGIVCEKNNWKVGVLDWLPIIHFSAFTYRSEKSDIKVSEYAQRAESNMYQYFINNNLISKVSEFRTLSEKYAI
jgi:hypothetical protein